MKIIYKYMFKDGITLVFPKLPDDDADTTVKTANAVLNKSYVWDVGVFPHVQDASK